MRTLCWPPLVGLQPAMEVGPEQKVQFVDAGGPYITDIIVLEARGVKTLVPEVADDAPRECVMVVEALSRAKVLCVYICRSWVTGQHFAAELFIKPTREQESGLAYFLAKCMS